MTMTTNHGASLVMDSFFEPLKEFLITATGLSYYRNRDRELAVHLVRHMSKLAITDCLSYLRLLRSESAGDRELDNLIKDLTIGETFFFRHADLFTALERTILPEVIERNKKQRRLRIWSAGSSIGAEAYTMSILLRRHLSHLIRDWEVTIIGTDINRSFLSRAAHARFENWALRGVSEELKVECFTLCGKLWTLHPNFQEGVSFQYHNLAQHSFPSMLHNLFAFDVILCRNVMIYFSSPVIANIVNDMQRCLVDGGWLLVGHAEHNQELFRNFRTVNLDGAIGYQRVDGPATLAVNLSQPDLSHGPLPVPSVAPVVSWSPGRDTGTTVRSPSVQGDQRSEQRAGRETSPQQRETSPQQRETSPRQRESDEVASIRHFADRGEIERADVLCRQLLTRHKLNPAYHLYHALIVEQLGQHGLCEQTLRRAIYLDRNFVLAHYYLGLTLQRLGRGAEAARSLRNTRQLLTTLDPECSIENSDGLTAVELDEMTRMHLEVIES